MSPSSLRKSNWIRSVAAVLVGLALGLLQVIPVRSQTLHLEALRTTEPVPIDRPWADIWDRAASQEVPLSAQNVAPPFGGGGVSSVVARALYDDDRIYLLMEWADNDVDDAVNGIALYSDAAAVQFPAIPGTAPPYTMGAPDVPVNIWQWKAVWQADLDSGYATTQDRFPDSYVDYYQGGDDPLYRPAEAVGNPLAQRSRGSPIENLLAEGFGSLTTAPTQDVDGSGAWQSGRWRALFVRGLAAGEEGYARFSAGEPTLVAFAVWDGGAGDRNGEKSIAPFIDLTLTDATIGTPGVPPTAGGSPWLLVGALLIIMLVAARLATFGRSGSARVEEANEVPTGADGSAR
ncbi:MAG: ethylbenzene dehydrogenase-related protein [Acidimicrobiia bacterium]